MGVGWESRFGVFGQETCGTVSDGHADGDDDGEGEAEPEAEGAAG